MGAKVHLERLQSLYSLDAFALWLSRPGSWLGGFDLPFGLPRELVQACGWPLEWEACVRHFATLSRAQIRGCFKAFCDARPAGSKFAHRATDRPAGSSPSMKWVNPPVAYMLHAGVPLLLDAAVHFPGLQPAFCGGQSDIGPGAKLALEAYPGMLARRVLGRRSYKSDDPARQTQERQNHRAELVYALQRGVLPGWTLELSMAQSDALVLDPRGDSLDAVLCLMQAAWASAHGAPWYGLPADMDRLEGWIVGAGAAQPAWR